MSQGPSVTGKSPSLIFYFSQISVTGSSDYLSRVDLVTELCLGPNDGTSYRLLMVGRRTKTQARPSDTTCGRRVSGENGKGHIPPSDTSKVGPF